MPTNARFAEVAAMAGDLARAAMLHALMDGRALTASELARVAGITPQTGSAHLAKLTDAGLLSVVKQGRHRYHRLATPAVARMIESIMQVAAGAESLRRPPAAGPRDAALRSARTCYDHIAGRLGVAIADAMVEGGYVELGDDLGLVTEAGIQLLDRLGVRSDTLLKQRGRRSTRPFCRPCLDWSERRPHLAGIVGAALCARSLETDWIRRMHGTRAVTLTPKGQQVLQRELGIQSGSLTG